MDITTNTLTKPQADGLRRIMRGPECWCAGSRAGGAVGRMFDRMALAGLCTSAPHYITSRGRKALAAYDESKSKMRRRSRGEDS